MNDKEFEVLDSFKTNFSYEVLFNQKLGEGGLGATYKTTNDNIIAKFQIVNNDFIGFVMDELNIITDKDFTKLDFVPKLYNINLVDITYRNGNIDDQNTNVILDNIENYIKNYNHNDTNKELILIIFQEKLDVTMGQRMLNTPFEELNKEVIEYIPKFHKAGFVHLDIKPDNIMYKKEQFIDIIYKFYFIDFGLTKKIANLPDEEENIFIYNLGYNNEKYKEAIILIYKLFDYIYYYYFTVIVFFYNPTDSSSREFNDVKDDIIITRDSIKPVIAKLIKESNVDKTIINNLVVPILLHKLSYRFKNNPLGTEYFFKSLGIPVSSDNLEQERKLILITISDNVKKIYYFENPNSYPENFNQKINNILKELGSNYKNLEITKDNIKELKDKTKVLIKRVKYLDSLLKK